MSLSIGDTLEEEQSWRFADSYNPAPRWAKIMTYVGVIVFIALLFVFAWQADWLRLPVQSFLCDRIGLCAG